MINRLLEKENIKVTVEIIARIRDVRQELLKRFKDAMLKRVHEEFGETWEAEILGVHGEVVVPVPDLQEKWSGLYFFKPKWSGRFAIGFCNEAPDARSVLFGVWHWNIELLPSPFKGLKEELDKEGKGKSSANWTWYRPVVNLVRPDYGDWHSQSVIESMGLDASKQLVDELFPFLEKTIGIAEKYIDQEVARQS